MGLGQFPAGVGPYGFDPVPDPTPVTPATEMQSAYFDLGLRDVPLDDDGNLKQMHPVDQAMQLAIGMRTGTFKARPTDGIKLAELQRLAPARRLATVITKVNAAANDLIKNGDVRIELVELIDQDVRGRLFFVVHYFNLRDPRALEREPQRVKGAIS